MSVLNIKCINCGANVIFDPQTQQYKCEYCLSFFTQEQLEAISAALKAADQDESPVREDSQLKEDGQVGEENQPQEEDQAKEEIQPQEENQAKEESRTGEDAPTEAELAQENPAEEEVMVLYECPSCGAKIVTDETTAATFCYYCHNSIVLSGRLKGEYRPDFVIPFAIDKDRILEIFTEWIKGKKYVPRAFFSQDQIEKVAGVYFPYWTYSCEVESELNAQGNQIKTWTTGRTQYTETSKMAIRRSGSLKIEHVPRNALKKANRELVEGVFPFNMREVKPFSAGYLSGFQAENRDMQQQEFVQEVEDEVRDFAWNSLKQQATGSYSAVTILDSKTVLAGPEWKYALLPVWTLTYRVPGSEETYYFACNGQNGKICGKLPIDKERLTRLFLSIFVPVLAALLFVGWLI